MSITIVEEARRKIGLSQPQMLAVLGAKPGRLSILTAEKDEDIDPIFVQKARFLRWKYLHWRQAILAEVDKHPDGLTLQDFAAILGCSKYLLYQMHSRGIFRAERHPGSRRFIITPAFVREFFHLNESIGSGIEIVDVSGETHRLIRGPLADFFLRSIGFRYVPRQRRTTPYRQRVQRQTARAVPAQAPVQIAAAG